MRARHYFFRPKTILYFIMKKIIFALLLICGLSQAASAQVAVPRQEIPYNVNYHWGLIDVMIARGTVSIESDGNVFYGTLDGTSIPWEGKIICVSDTLHAATNFEGGTFNEKVFNQTGWYRRPSVSSFRSSTYNPEDPAIYKNIAGQGAYDASNNSMEAITVTSDMIAVYYYAHAINFDALKPGEQIWVNIDGPYSRKMVLTYKGQSTQNVSGVTYPTYDCTFEFDYGGGMSGYPVECNISVTDRIPVFLCANLPVGRVEMLYDPY